MTTFAYVFWHRPEPSQVEDRAYEEALRTFHASLRAALPVLRGSASYRVRGLPWLDGADGYEDWYLLPGFAELAELNDTAVSDVVREAHDRAALASAWGAGGLYATVHGEPDLEATAVTWITKPRDVRYLEFFASLPPTPCLLRRQLVLGPAPEFCAFGELAGGLVAERGAVTSGAGAPAAPPDR